MTSEIDLLLEADAEGQTIVHKDTNVLWSRADLLEARELGEFAADDRLTEADPNSSVTSPFPGCMQWSGKASNWENVQPVAQTVHFVIFGVQSPAARA